MPAAQNHSTIAALALTARMSRSAELRDWEECAQRAASYAFTPSGRRLHEELQPLERNLRRLEGRGATFG